MSMWALIEEKNNAIASAKRRKFEDIFRKRNYKNECVIKNIIREKMINSVKKNKNNMAVEMDEFRWSLFFYSFTD